MNQPPHASKRVVSKSRYVADLVQKSFAFLGGLFILLLGVGFAIGGIAVIGGTLYQMCISHVEVITLLIGMGLALISLILCGVPAALLLRLGMDVVKDTQQIDIGVPRTRANTAYLPAPESLVRAASEPGDEQEAVLLRAAIEGTDKHEEQLVRAVIGPE